MKSTYKRWALCQCKQALLNLYMQCIIRKEAVKPARARIVGCLELLESCQICKALSLVPIQSFVSRNEDPTMSS